MATPTFTESCPPQSLGTFSLLFNQLILGLLNSTCDITTTYPADVSPHILNTTQFDFIIIGAGATGSVIAARLSEICNWNILLIEAGDDPPIEADVPGFEQYTWFSSSDDFMYYTEPSPYLCRAGKNNRCFVPRGKMLGGCTAHNTLAYSRGNPQDYNRWAVSGNFNWSYKEVLPNFKNLESVLVNSLRNEEHGTTGPQSVEFFPKSTQTPIIELQQSVYRAAVEAGIPPVEDVATRTMNGIGRILATIKNGVRQNTARSYLAPIRQRPNLFIMKRTLVTKIMFNDKKRACGVIAYKNNEYKQIRASKEVIVSAGAVNSPQLLLLSGVGPAEHLRQFGLKTVQNLRVGYNLRDHYSFIGAFFSYNAPGTKPLTPSQQSSEMVDSLYQYLTKHTGPLADLGLDREIFYDTTGRRPDYPDVQVNLVSLPISQFASFFQGFEIRPEVIKDLVANVRGDYVMAVYVTSLRPGIEGRVHLNSANPFDAPVINFDFPSSAELQRRRVQKILAGIALLERMNNTESLRSKGIQLEKAYIKGCDGSWECLIPNFSTSFYHLSGTDKMGPRSDPNAVVDNFLKVHGLKGLRVADISMMPHLVGGNPAIPCMMIGEKVSDMIKQEYGY